MFSSNNLRVTLDTIHQKYINNNQSNLKLIPKLEKQKKTLLSKIKKLKAKKKKDLTEEQLDNLFEFDNKVKDINKKINDLSNEYDLNNYYLNVGDVLFQYYDKKKNPIMNSYKTESKNLNKKNIINFFNNTNLKKEEVIIPKDESDSEYYKGNMKYLSKKDILNKYLNFTIDDYINESKYNINYDKCSECNVEMSVVFSEGVIICKKCGKVEDILINSDKPSYKDPPKELSYFAYKRINHFNEWLAQFQAKESTDIPQEVFDQILVEIKKERINNMAKITKLKLRNILKKLKLNKYYEHVPHIINRLNGIPAPVMDRNTEEKLRMMFKEIQGPFMKHCPKNRKNFLSYSYVLHKFVQLLELDEFLPCFTLLKSREKLHQQDMIWQKICKELKWEYIKSL